VNEVESNSFVAGERTRTGDDIVAGNVYDKYHAKNPVARYLMGGFMRAFDSLFQPRAGDSILEVGCGEGHLLDHMQSQWCGRLFSGLDLAHSVVRQARDEIPMEVSIMQASAYQLPWRDGTWDIAVACEVLEHLDHPEMALAELRRVCRRGCLVSVPREPIWRGANMVRFRYLSRLGNTPGHVQHWGRRGFVDMVGKHFAVEEVRNPFPWTMIWGTKDGQYN